MRSLHVRDVPEPVIAALRERAARHEQSMQAELRQILQAAAEAGDPVTPVSPLSLVTVRTAGTSTWTREEIYGETGR